MHQPRIKGVNRQAGFTLIELLVGLAVSLIAVSGMLLVMSSTVGSTAQVIEATRASSELRAALQLVSREVRRANFSEDFTRCIGLGDQACAFVTDEFAYDPDAECMTYAYRRYDYAADSWPADEDERERGAVRRIDSTLEFNPAGDCDSDVGWERLTDPNIVSVTNFTVTEVEGDELLSHVQQVSGNLSQRVRKYRIRLTGFSCRAGDVATCGAANRNVREVETSVRVRNDLIFET